MEQQQKNHDIDNETIHQQEINVIITEEIHNRQESSDNDSSANTNNNNDTWSITTCNKNELEHDQQSKDKNHNNDQQQVKNLFRFWNKLKERITNNHSSTTIDPRNFSTSKKRSIMIQMMFAAIVTPLATTIAFPALPTMQKDLETSETAINAAITSIYVFFNASVPILWASYSDVYGRRRIYLISILIAIIGNICCGLSVNIAMLIVFRIMGAVGSSSILTVGTGILSDIYGPGKRGKAYSWFVSAPLVVPAIAPVIGGYLTEGLGWRSTFFCIAIYCFCIWIVMVFALPESIRRVENFDNLPTSATTTKEICEKEVTEQTMNYTTAMDLKMSVETKKQKHVNPLSAIKLLRNGNVVLPALFAGFLYFTFYIINTNMTWIYTNQYGFSAGIVGLCYLPGALGGICGSQIAGSISDKLYAADIKKGRKAYPERRLHYPLFGSSITIFILSVITYGWCTNLNVHFAYGLIALFFAFASLIIPSIILVIYLVECYPKYSASTAGINIKKTIIVNLFICILLPTTCNNLIRFCLGGVGALVASDLQLKMGNGPLLSMCAGVTLLGFGLLVWTKQNRAKWASTKTGDAEGLDNNN